MPRESPTLTIARRSGVESVELPGARVVLTHEDGSEEVAPLGLEAVWVGTSAECRLVAKDPNVSRMHCRLALSPDGVAIRDPGSKNGTWVGGLRIREAILPVGEAVTIGRSTVRVDLGGKGESVPLAREARFGEARGKSTLMRALFAKLARAAQGESSVLLLGESGTGKELLARAVHDESPRKERPFVVLDCSAIAPTLIEAELFGHVKGAFTGAEQGRAGYFEAADGGTIFLDEVGELPLELQPRLLRAIEAKEIRPVGGQEFRRTDVRVVAATHRDLAARVASGSFRQDLYYRLAVVELSVPPLRDRKEDIPLLVDHFLRSETPPRALADLGPNALELLAAHDWPGNVRELRNTIARLLLFPDLGQEALGPSRGDEGPLGRLGKLPLREARDALVADFEARYLALKLAEAKGSVSALAQAIGVSRQFAYRLLERYGLGADDARG
jgi:transcriptional regulator with PAS, ATPase and Fis domain